MTRALGPAHAAERARADEKEEGSAATVVWHDLECGRYAADLQLWRDLAAEAATHWGADDAPILDVGAGSGRVALDLARRGHDITALDIDAELLRALRDRADGPIPRVVRGDARALPEAGDSPVGRRDYALCIAAMQTVQLLGDEGRGAFLRGVRTHLCPGGILACALVAELEPFDCADGDPAPAPESARIDGRDYSSQPLRVDIEDGTIAIERERTVRYATGRILRERDVVELDRVSTELLEREAAAAGMRALEVRTVAATDDHVGSTVVVLGV